MHTRPIIIAPTSSCPTACTHRTSGGPTAPGVIVDCILGMTVHAVVLSARTAAFFIALRIRVLTRCRGLGRRLHPDGLHGGSHRSCTRRRTHRRRLQGRRSQLICSRTSCRRTICNCHSLHLTSCHRLSRHRTSIHRTNWHSRLHRRRPCYVEDADPLHAVHDPSAHLRHLCMTLPCRPHSKKAGQTEYWNLK